MGVAAILNFKIFNFFVTWLSSGSIYVVVCSISSKSGDFLPRDAMHMRGLCRHHAVSECVSVSVSVTFVSCVKTNKDIFEMFSPSGSHIILVFLYQTGWRYSDGNFPNVGVECRWGRQKSQFWAICLLLTLQQARCCKHGRRGRRPPSRKLWHLYAGRILQVFDHQAPRAIKSLSPWFFSARATKRALALNTITIDRMYDSKAWRYAEDNRTASNCMH